MRMESLESYSLQLEMRQYRHNPDGLFYEKRHVVLLKMTRRFVENDTLFFFDRRVVFGVSKCRVFVSMKGLKNVQCDTCDSKKTKTPVMRVYARA